MQINKILLTKKNINLLSDDKFSTSKTTTFFLLQSEKQKTELNSSVFYLLKELFFKLQLHF